ncbi:MAG: hypothetical protein ACREM3_02640 [Candidatus Rokuibacteriota bacterium]
MDERRLVGRVVPVVDLSRREVDQMFAVHARLYDRVSEREFRSDLAEKDWVLLLRHDRDGEIRGFTTLVLLDVEVGGEPLRAVFSGDTAIEPRFWGGQALVKTWAHFMGELRRQHADLRLFWFLISKGYRTYLYLPLFFHAFYPRAGVATPPFERALIHALATRKYPRAFNAETGIIEHSHGHLMPALADVSEHRRQHPHVGFFLERNPGYARGHELACVAEISPDNMKGLARRMLLEGGRALAVGL